MEKRTRPRLDATEVALFLAMCAVLTIAGCVLMQGIDSGTIPGAPGSAPALPSAQAGTEGVAGGLRAGPPHPPPRSDGGAPAGDGPV